METVQIIIRDTEKFMKALHHHKAHGPDSISHYVLKTGHYHERNLIKCFF